MSTAPHEILTPDEAAKLLRVPVSTVYALARQGQLPGFKVGKHLRFYRTELLQQRMQAVSLVQRPPKRVAVTGHLSLDRQTKTAQIDLEHAS